MDSLFSDLAKEFAKPDEPSDPVKWADQVAGIKLWSKQREILASVGQHKLTAVQSAHGTGKSLLASILAAWWICTHPYDDTIVISTAPSKNQVHGILWENIRRIHRDADLPGVVQLSDNWIVNRVLVGQGRKPQDYSQHAFQGIHAKYVLFILDEACGINKWIWTSAITNTTSEDCRVLAIGNPDDPSSEFARICRAGSGWNNIRISVWDSPRFTGEDPEIYEGSSLVDETYVETAKREWGQGSPVWQSKVEGLFPLVDDFAVIPKGWILKAFERWHLYNEAEPDVQDDRIQLPKPRKILGVDVARMGDDKTVIATRINDTFTDFEEFSKMDTVETANAVMARMNKGRDKAVIDMTGLGSGVYDIIKNRGYKVEAFNAGARTELTDTTRQLKFTRVRSAAWWKLRDALDPAKSPTIALPPIDKLEADLATPTWEHVLNGQIQVESKDDIRKRLGASTDYADAAIMAWFARPHVVEHIDEAAFRWDDHPEENEGVYSWDLNPDWRDTVNEHTLFNDDTPGITYLT